MSKLRNGALLLCIALLAACSMSKDFAAGEAAVIEFRKDYEAREFEKIYDRSHDQMKKVVTKTQLIGVLESMQAKLGSVSETARTNARINYKPAGGTELIMSYATKFERGSANEHFIFMFANDHPIMVGYRITDSQVFILGQPTDTTI